MPHFSTLGQRLFEKRRELDLRQRDLADAAGCTPQAISRVERGTTSGMNSKYLRKVARVLGVTTDWLVGMDMQEEDIIDRLHQARAPLSREDTRAWRRRPRVRFALFCNDSTP